MNKVASCMLTIWKKLRDIIPVLFNNFDVTFKVIIIISIAAFLFMYWNKDRYSYHEAVVNGAYGMQSIHIVIFDKQTGEIYYPYEPDGRTEEWEIYSPFREHKDFVK